MAPPKSLGNGRSLEAELQGWPPMVLRLTRQNICGRRGLRN